MKQPFTSSLWILVITLVLIALLVPFDAHLSVSAQSLPDAIVQFNRTITDFGTFGWMIYAAAGLTTVAYIAERSGLSETVQSRARTARFLSLYILVTIGTASALVHMLKFVIGRARPELIAEMGAHSLTPFAGGDLFASFPSGHSTAVGAFFGAFSMLVPQLRPLFALGALTIGVSRVIVGAHYPSDVAAGLLLGLWSAVMIAFIFLSREWLFSADARGWPVPKHARPGLDSDEKTRMSSVEKDTP